VAHFDPIRTRRVHRSICEVVCEVVLDFGYLSQVNWVTERYCPARYFAYNSTGRNALSPSDWSGDDGMKRREFITFLGSWVVA